MTRSKLYINISYHLRNDTLLKVINHYDFNVLSMSVMGFQKSLDKGVGSIQFLFGFSDFVLTL